MIIQIIFCSIGFLLSLATALYVLINRKKTVSNIVLKEGEILIASNKKTLRFSLIINIVSNAGLLLFLILAILKKLGENSYLLYLVLLVLFVILSCKYILEIVRKFESEVIEFELVGFFILFIFFKLDFYKGKDIEVNS